MSISIHKQRFYKTPDLHKVNDPRGVYQEIRKLDVRLWKLEQMGIMEEQNGGFCGHYYFDCNDGKTRGIRFITCVTGIDLQIKLHRSVRVLFGLPKKMLDGSKMFFCDEEVDEGEPWGAAEGPIKPPERRGDTPIPEDDDELPSFKPPERNFARGSSGFINIGVTSDEDEDDFVSPHKNQGVRVSVNKSDVSK